MSILINDIDNLTNTFDLLDEFKGKSVLVSGATGLIGGLLVKTLLYADAKKNLSCSVYALVRNVSKMQKIVDEFTCNMTNDERDIISRHLNIISCDLMRDDITINEEIDYIVHAAAVTTSKDMVTYPVDNIMISIMGTNKVLDLAREKKSSVVYLSSMEVYGQMDVSDHLISEDELGYVDLSAARSCYPEGKRMCECLCNAYALQYGVRVMTARLAQTFGPGISKDENRVFAQFAKSVINENDIVLHTKGESEGNYVYTMDAVTGILTLLAKGQSGQAYNVSNVNSHMTIGNMAQMVASEVAEGRIKVVFDIPEDANTYGYAAPTRMHLDNKKLVTLGWEAKTSLKETYIRLIEYMKE